MAKNSITVFSIFMGLLSYSICAQATLPFCPAEYATHRSVYLPVRQITDRVKEDPRLFETAAGFLVAFKRPLKYLSVGASSYSEKNLVNSVRAALRAVPIMSGVGQLTITVRKHSQPIFAEDFYISVNYSKLTHLYPLREFALLGAEIQYAIRKHVLALPLIAARFKNPETPANRVQITLNYVDGKIVPETTSILFDQPRLLSPADYLYQNYKRMMLAKDEEFQREIDEEEKDLLNDVH